MTGRSAGNGTVGAVMTALGAFIMLCAAGGMWTFSIVSSRHSAFRHETTAITRFLLKYFWVLAPAQLGVGAVLVIIGLVLMWRRRARAA